VSRSSGLDRLAALVRLGRERWRRRLQERSGGWDVCVLTAANERQAEGYRLQLEERKRDGGWPAGREWMIVADPNGRRIGAGLATIHASMRLNERMGGGYAWLTSKKVLMLHCGGSSIRMPHCAAFGKIFAPLPSEAPCGRCSTIFDENLSLLEGLADAAPPGVTVAAGDVLVVFDPRKLTFDQHGTTALTVAAPAKMGEGHGVFLDSGGGFVGRVFQKYSSDRLRGEGVVAAGGNVLIDTGIFHLSPPLIRELCSETRKASSPLSAALRDGIEVDLYADLTQAMAIHTPRAEYVSAVPTAERRLVRRRLWTLLHERHPLRFTRAAPGAFFHLGSTLDYCRACRPGSRVGRVFDFVRHVASDRVRNAGEATLMECRVALRARGRIEQDAIAHNCFFGGRHAVGEDALVSGIRSESAFSVGARLVVFQTPVRLPQDYPTQPLRGASPSVAAVYGVKDNPKLGVGGGALFMNRPFRDWLTARNIGDEDIWPDAKEEAAKTLWEARLFPVAEAAGALEWAHWFQAPHRLAMPSTQKWRTRPRLSLKQLVEYADRRLLAGVRREEDT
jgi:fucokinase